VTAARAQTIRGDTASIAVAALTPHGLLATGLIPDPTNNQYAVTADGRKFLVLEPRKGFNETYSVVLNWPATVK